VQATTTIDLCVNVFNPFSHCCILANFQYFLAQQTPLQKLKKNKIYWQCCMGSDKFDEILTLENFHRNIIDPYITGKVA
jgi:hypothetical protein